MTPIEWGPNLILFVPQMDREHSHLAVLANQFLAAMDAGEPRAALEARLTQLIEAFREHADSEQDLMRSSGYPDLELHTAQHRKLIEQINGLRDGLGSGTVVLSEAVALFVRVWIEQHITGPDADFAKFLRANKSSSGPDSLSVGR